MGAAPPPVTLGGYWVNTYQPACRQDRTKYCDDLVEGFVGAMRSRGHRGTVIRSDVAASPRHWERATDSGPDGVDTVEFAYLSTHGGTYGKERSGGGWVHWVVATFTSPQGCRLTTVQLGPNGVPVDLNNIVVKVRLGDGSLRWVILDLCRSLQIGHENEEVKDLANADLALQLRDANPANTWTRCFGGVHIIFGFTALSSDAWWTRKRGKSFGRRAGAGEPLAESWLDEAYSSVCDDAPVALAWGRFEGEARRRLKAETLAHPEVTLAPAEVKWACHMWRS